MFELTGKNALVTGATGGIGRATAKALAAQGANLVLSSTNEGKLQALADEIEGDVKYLTCNLSDMEQVNALFEKAEELVGGQIDILVCNAGITKDSLILRMKDEDFEQVLDVNLKSTFALNRNAIKKMNLFLDDKKKSEALKFLPKLSSELMRIAKTGIIKKENASRNISRITKKISAL